MTKYVEYNNSLKHNKRNNLRFLSKIEFIDKYASGTLRKSNKLGFDIHNVYLQERVKFEFGEEFETIEHSRLQYTDIEINNTRSFTELGWHLERMIEMRPYDQDIFVGKYITVEYKNGIVKSGYGIFVKQTCVDFLNSSHVIFAIIMNDNNNICLNPF